MTTPTIKEQVLSQLDHLSPEQQQQVLNFARGLQQESALPPGTPGEVLLAHIDSFEFEPGDLEEMARSIEQGCERIDLNEW